jgi:Protein of unknown function (DUF551)
MWNKKELLPESEGLYLVCVQGSFPIYVDVAFYSDGWFIYDAHDDIYSVSINNLTHWMPLPAPPTAEAVEGANLQPLWIPKSIN